ncbi:hypothetical protein [Tolypothrix sp. VBCCA 56010]|uniref:hypothetical protein n=1 Tax=Tolypothrix sp. VBCCA 56010 TaxID=3137731 RepID=UPI003D7DB5E3
MSKIPPQIEVLDDSIIIQNLEISLFDAVDFLQQIPESERKAACINAFEIGFFCLQRVHQNDDVEFVKREFDYLLAELEKAVALIPSSLEKNLASKIGTENGQLLAPMQTQIHLTRAVIAEQLEAVRNLFISEIDISKDTSTLGGVINKIQNLLDPNRLDSVQGVFLEALKNATIESGVLAKSVKSVVEEAVKPLASEVDKLAQQIREQELVESVLEQTIAKGATYEELVLAELQKWSKTCGAEISYVGDENRPGDILIKLTSNSVVGIDLTIILEARNRESQRWGRTKISRHLESAMARYEANSAIFLSHSLRGLGKDVGEFGQGECQYGSWVATHHDMMNIALQFLILRQQLASQQTFNSQIDGAAIEGIVQQIESSLKHITQINTYLTDMEKNTEGIRDQAKALRKEIRSSLSEIMGAISKNKLQG